MVYVDSIFISGPVYSTVFQESRHYSPAAIIRNAKIWNII